jgi:starch phosphorylase
MFSYTNHTLMPEALETWDVEMLSRLLPRHLEIIFDINADFLKQVGEKFGRDVDLIRRISLVDEYGQRRVRMAHLAIVASHTVNGVSKLHSQLMTQNIFADFARMYPDRFTNVTNGITPRRWLSQASPKLSSLIDERLGPRWRTDLFELGRLREWRDDPEFSKVCQQGAACRACEAGDGGDHRPECTVRFAGQAYSRIQAPVAQHLACDCAL